MAAEKVPNLAWIEALSKCEHPVTSSELQSVCDVSIPDSIPVEATSCVHKKDFALSQCDRILTVYWPHDRNSAINAHLDAKLEALTREKQ